MADYSKLSGAGGAIGQLTGGIAGVLGGKPMGPRSSIRATGQGTLRGYQDTGPLSFALNELYNPSYLSLGGRNLQDLLFGSQTRDYTTTVPDEYNKKGVAKGSRTVSGTIPGAPGLLDTIRQTQQRMASDSMAANDLYRQNQINQAAKYIPQARQLFAAANPEQAALQGQIGADAQEQLALGDRVNPELVRNWQNQNTARYANMGFRPNEGFVQADDFMRYTGGAQALRTGRQGYALDALSRLNATEPSYANFVLGMNDPSQGQGYGLVTGQQPLTFTGNQYSPYNVNTTSLSNQAQGNQMESDAQQAAYWGGIGSGTAGTAASFAGAFG